jgi:hypothetical protein
MLTLEELGYLTHDGRYFQPTPRMLRLRAALLETSPLPRLGPAGLKAARDQLVESVPLGGLEGDWSVFVAKTQQSWSPGCASVEPGVDVLVQHAEGGTQFWRCLGLIGSEQRRQHAVMNLGAEDREP